VVEEVIDTQLNISIKKLFTKRCKIIERQIKYFNPKVFLQNGGIDKRNTIKYFDPKVVYTMAEEKKVTIKYFA
jgi:hypothetical protein